MKQRWEIRVEKTIAGVEAVASSCFTLELGLDVSLCAFGVVVLASVASTAGRATD